VVTVNSLPKELPDIVGNMKDWKTPFYQPMPRPTPTRAGRYNVSAENVEQQLQSCKAANIAAMNNPKKNFCLVKSLYTWIKTVGKMVGHRCRAPYLPICLPY
jgi:hypothetical protein